MAVYKFRNLTNGQATPIPDGEFSIGRGDDTYIHIDDGSVSRRHAMLINQGGQLFVEDLGSSNGTAAHGAYLTARTKVQLGDVIHVGSVAFRVDPEVAGEPEEAPSAGMRANNRSYMRRDTERLVTPGSAPRVIEPISPEKLSAPAVNPDDLDAEDLNAITIREPGTPAQVLHVPPEPAPALVAPATTSAPLPAIRATSQGNFTPPTAPAATPQRQAIPLGRASQRIVLPEERTDPDPIMLPRSEFTAPRAVPQPAPVAPAPAPAAPAPTTHWGWWLLMFLAGLGVGLLLGLVFARIFIELGGKAGLLP